MCTQGPKSTFCKPERQPHAAAATTGPRPVPKWYAMCSQTLQVSPWRANVCGHTVRHWLHWVPKWYAMCRQRLHVWAYSVKMLTVRVQRRSRYGSTMYCIDIHVAKHYRWHHANDKHSHLVSAPMSEKCHIMWKITIALWCVMTHHGHSIR